MTFTKITQTEFSNTSVGTQTEIKTYAESYCQTDLTTDIKAIGGFREVEENTPNIEIKIEENENAIKTEEFVDELIFVETNYNVKVKCDPLDISKEVTKTKHSKRKKYEHLNEVSDNLEHGEDYQENCPLSLMSSKQNDSEENEILGRLLLKNSKIKENGITKTVKNEETICSMNDEDDKQETIFDDNLFTTEETEVAHTSVQIVNNRKTAKTHKQVKKTKRKRNIEEESDSIKVISTKKKKSRSKSVTESEVDTTQYNIDLAHKKIHAKQMVLEEAIKDIQQQWRIHERNFRTHGLTKKKPECEQVTEQNEEEIAEKIRMSHGRKYGKELKFLALNLFYSNPIAYKALRSKLSLPVEKTLRRIDVGVSTKLTKTAMKCLKILADRLNGDEKYCIICADLLPVTPKLHKLTGKDKIVGYHEIGEVQLQEQATQVLVVMVRSLVSEWKQPLLCSYLKENFDYCEVISWFDNIIKKITECGLNIVAFTSKPDRHFITMSMMRNVTPEKPYFIVNNIKIYQVFDAAILLVGLRDLLMDHNIEFDYENQHYTASWEDIEKLYVTDLSRTYKLAPKLNEQTIRPLDLDKLRVDLAVQLFSNTVASALNQYIELKVLCAKSLGTVKLVELLNQLFDVLNCSSETEINKYKQPFVNKPHQKDILDKFLNILPTFKVTDQHNQDVTSGVDEISCMETTIKSVLGISSDLLSKGYEILYTRNLSMEYLHNYLLHMRKTRGQKNTAINFRGAFHFFYLQHIIKKSENNSSCGLDKDLISALMYQDD